MNENTPQDLLEIGRVGRSHGVKGEMYISLTSDRTERQQSGTTIWISGSAYVVQAIRPSNDRWLVFLEGIHSPEAAAALTNQLIFAEPIDDDDALWVHELVGSRVVGIDGTNYGTCTAVLDNPAHPIIETDLDVLIPLPFVVEYRDGEVRVNPPLGLLELSNDEESAQ